MQKIDNSMKPFLHGYEAYRIPKGTTVKDSAGKDIVLSEEKDVLVLTEKASKQLRSKKTTRTNTTIIIKII